MKKLAVFAVAAMVAAAAFADYGFYEDNIQFGGYTGAFSGWSGDSDNPTDLGEVYDLTLTSVSFNIWSDANDRGGANLYYRIYDANGQVGTDQDIHLGGATFIEGSTHDYSISYSTPVDMAAAVGLTLVDGTDYYIDVWAKSYGDSGDEWYSNGGANYHAKMTYAVPEPATMSLLGLGALAMVLRRKLRK